jgi:methionyl-tRNA formyltransferase
MKLMYLSSGPREGVLRRLLASRHEVAGVFVTDPDRWPKVAPTVAIAKSEHLPLAVLKRTDLFAPPAALRDAVCLSVGFAFILPPEFLRYVRVCLNVHGTLLPKYPGARSLNWVIARGETQSGVTVHLVDEGVDSGPIVLQRSFVLSPFETGASLARKTREFEPQVVIEALDLFEREGLVIAKPQTGQRVELPDRIPAHSRIDPNKPLNELIDTIRAADPVHYPAFFEYGGAKICIRLWRAEKPAGEEDLL